MYDIAKIVMNKGQYTIDELQSIPLVGTMLHLEFCKTNTKYLKSQAIINILYSKVMEGDDNISKTFAPMRNRSTKVEIQVALKGYWHYMKTLKLEADVYDATLRSIWTINDYLETTNRVDHVRDLFKQIFITHYFTYSYSL